MSLFTSAFLGQVQHPINILQEYLAAFGNKCQAAILSWLDNWAKTKRKENQSGFGLYYLTWRRNLATAKTLSFVTCIIYSI